MHRFFIKTPWWAKKIFSSYLWKMPAGEKVVYLSFDDGPHPTITPWVLDELKKFNAAATFFCVGKNVVQFPEIYQQVLTERHAVGNHTYHHLNGWKTATDVYLNDVEKANAVIESSLFRPPYGRITSKQAKGLKNAMQTNHPKVVMWDVLSADFDASLSPQDCARNVLTHAEPGSIVVFHDSEKALKNLKYALPVVLENLGKAGFCFKKIDGSS